MKYHNSEISMYVDTMIVDAILSDDAFVKTAQGGSIITSLIDKVKQYFNNHIDPNDKAGSLINLLAPGVIAAALKTMGFGWFGTLAGIAMSIFHIDVNAALHSIWNKLKSPISSNKQLTSSQVDEMVNDSIKEHSPETSENEIKFASVSQQLREASLFKLAMVEYEKTGTIKEAQSLFGKSRYKTQSLLSKILGWIFKIAISSAGFMVAGDVVNKFLGRPNALDGTIQNGKPVAVTNKSAPTIPIHVATQTKFKLNPSYHIESNNSGASNWVENVHNDPDSIESMLIAFTKQVYQGLNGLEALIKSSPSFQFMKNKIAFYNHSSEGDPFVFIPKQFTSKKQVVDMFIDDVADRVK